MCMADGADTSEVSHSWTRKARKAHRCSECGRTIATGETYQFGKALSEGIWFENKRCAHCGVLADWLSEECGGYLYEGVIEDFADHAEEYQRFDLRRLQWGALHKWTHKGVLLPVPKIPLTSEQRAAT